jgi:hypothetical protein
MSEKLRTWRMLRHIEAAPDLWMINPHRKYLYAYVWEWKR